MSATSVLVAPSACNGALSTILGRRQGVKKYHDGRSCQIIGVSLGKSFFMPNKLVLQPAAQRVSALRTHRLLSWRAGTEAGVTGKDPESIKGSSLATSEAEAAANDPQPQQRVERYQSKMKALANPIYDFAIPEETIEKPKDVKLQPPKAIGDKPRCGECEQRGVLECSTCGATGLYVDPIMESQGVVVKAVWALARFSAPSVEAAVILEVSECDKKGQSCWVAESTISHFSTSAFSLNAKKGINKRNEGNFGNQLPMQS
eukprot:jgi/Mesen1/10950/ME000096S10529